MYPISPSSEAKRKFYGIEANLSSLSKVAMASLTFLAFAIPFISFTVFS
jgi:hypothetical protein